MNPTWTAYIGELEITGLAWTEARDTLVRSLVVELNSQCDPCRTQAVRVHDLLDTLPPGTVFSDVVNGQGYEIQPGDDT